jgi:hypothetical protein
VTFEAPVESLHMSQEESGLSNRELMERLGAVYDEIRERGIGLDPEPGVAVAAIAGAAFLSSAADAIEEDVAANEPTNDHMRGYQQGLIAAAKTLRVTATALLTTRELRGR